jgi:PPOX class probable F420-dependent enzyme
MAEHHDPSALSDAARAFLEERHLATLSLRRADGRPHVTPVGFTYDEDRRLARVITWTDSWKTRHVQRDPDQVAALCQVDGGRWLTLYGTPVATTEPERTAEGVRRYTERYRPPKDRADRVVIEITVTDIVGRA